MDTKESSYGSYPSNDDIPSWEDYFGEQQNDWSEAMYEKYLDSVEGNIDEQFSTNNRVEDTLSITHIADKMKFHGLHLKEDLDSKELFLYDRSEKLVGYIKPGRYTYNGLDIEPHLEKYLFPDFRREGYGTFMWKLYKSLFGLPEVEYTHSRSSLMFLLQNRYEIVGKWNGSNFEEVKTAEIDDLYTSNNGTNFLDDELEFTYKLK